MTVYADVVFLVNFIMDSLIFLLTSILLKKRINKLLIIFGGFLGSILYCFLMLSYNSKFYNPLTSLFTIIIPLLIVFRPKSLKEFLKSFITINICAFFIGGVATAFFFYTNAKNYLGDLLSFTVEDFSLKLLIFSSSLSYIVIKIVRLNISKKMQKKQHIVNVEIRYKDIKKNFNALVDTGNTLREPTSNKHVIITEFSVCKDFLPNELKILFYEQNDKDITKIYEALDKIDEYDFLNSFRLIPFKSVGNENGTLIGIKTDEVTIFDELKKYKIEDVFIAIANFELTSSNDFNSLINPEIFEQERVTVWKE